MGRLIVQVASGGGYRANGLRRECSRNGDDRERNGNAARATYPHLQFTAESQYCRVPDSCAQGIAHAPCAREITQGFTSVSDNRRETMAHNTVRRHKDGLRSEGPA